MATVEFIKRDKAFMTFEGSTTVRTLRKILTAAGYDIEGKKCYITKNGVTKEATEGYVLEATDGILFDTQDQKQKVIININASDCDINVAGCSTTVSYR